MGSSPCAFNGQRLALVPSVSAFAPMPSGRPRKNKGTEPVNLLPPDGVLFGQSPEMQEVRQRAEKVCRTNISVLLVGAGGTGKEVLARWIHKHSTLCNGQFVKVNCAAIPGTLLESELFGYERGAFTGAYASKPGRVELAHNGTLFLDEIADLDPSLQSKLLHFLQDGRFSRIGDEVERTVKTRLICATNKDLQEEIDTQRFRADLYYRINVVQLRLPCLRERRGDIPALVDYFLDQFQKQFAKQAESLNEERLRYLQELNWPGNIRELSNRITRHVLIGANASIAEERPQPPQPADKVVASLKSISKEAIRSIERSIILEALRTNQWNRRRTAKALKISYRGLIYKIRDAGLGSTRTRGPKRTPEIGT